MEPMTHGAMVFVGGGIGAVLRWCAGALATRYAASGFPWGTFGVNLIGALAIGILAGMASRSALPEALRLFVVVGILGGFTTFSAFSIENVQLIREGQLGWALANIGLQVSLGLGLAALGFSIGMARGPQ